jgi:hypothetical protein
MAANLDSSSASVLIKTKRRGSLRAERPAEGRPFRGGPFRGSGWTVSDARQRAECRA